MTRSTRASLTAAAQLRRAMRGLAALSERPHSAEELGAVVGLLPRRALGLIRTYQETGIAILETGHAWSGDLRYALDPSVPHGLVDLARHVAEQTPEVEATPKPTKKRRRA